LNEVKKKRSNSTRDIQVCHNSSLRNPLRISIKWGYLATP
jgi:hypothetical protein